MGRGLSLCRPPQRQAAADLPARRAELRRTLASLVKQGYLELERDLEGTPRFRPAGGAR